MNVKIQRHLNTYNSIMKIDKKIIFYYECRFYNPDNCTLYTWSSFTGKIHSVHYTILRKIQSSMHIHIVSEI